MGDDTYFTCRTTRLGIYDTAPNLQLCSSAYKAQVIREAHVVMHTLLPTLFSSFISFVKKTVKMVVFLSASVKTTSIIAPEWHFSLPVEQWYPWKSGEKKYSYTEKLGQMSRHKCRDWTRGVFSAYLRPVRMSFPPLTVHVAFCEPFSLAKIVRLVPIPRTVNYSGTNFAAAFHRCNLGIPQNFSQNFLVKATWFASLWGSKEKDSKRYAVDDDWKFW